MIEMIITKIVRDLHSNYKKKKEEEQEEREAARANGDASESEMESQEGADKKDEFTIDEDFFHSVVMPSVYSSVVSSLK